MFGCGGDHASQPKDEPITQTAVPDSRLTSSEQHFVYITLNEENFPIESTKMYMTVPEDKKREHLWEAFYQPESGGYTLLLDEGEYCFIAVAEHMNRRYERYLVIDGEHNYYHIRFDQYT